MMSILVKVVIGLVLFVGSLLGGLAATGRLDHEGTANIPLLNKFFPAPPPPVDAAADGQHGAEGQPGDAAHDAAAGGEAAAAHAAAADAAHDGPPPAAVDAAHTGEAEPQGQDPNKRQVPKATKREEGKSIFETEKPAGGGHGGGGGEQGGGGADADAGHGAEGDHAADAGHGDGKTAHGKPAGETAHSTPEQDFDQAAQRLRSQGKVGYRPGEYFRFEGLPAGITPAQVNEAWQRVQGLMERIKQRETALDLREQDLNQLAEDIAQRLKVLGEERNKIEEMQRRLDTKIVEFGEQVKLVRKDEVAGLKRNAESLAAFERAKAAEIVVDKWKSEKGQDEVVKLFEFMEADVVNEILALLPTPTMQDVMARRLRVSKEASGAGKK